MSLKKSVTQNYFSTWPETVIRTSFCTSKY